MGNEIDLSRKNAVIVSHVYATGPAQELEEYLKSRVQNLLFLGHPFLYSQDIRSFARAHTRGRPTKLQHARSWRLTEPLSYAKDFLLTLRWVFGSRVRFDLFFGADSLNALTGIVLQKMRFVDKVVFYSVDFVPKRFQSRVLNHLYHLTERLCLKYCDEVWNLSEEMIKARKRMHLLDDAGAKLMVVPIGVWFSRIKRREDTAVDRFKLEYKGHLREGQGLRLVFEALPQVFETWRESSLMIIGTGPLEAELRRKAEELECQCRVFFKGYIEDHEALERLLTENGVGLAPYEPTPESFTWYADPSKPKQYLACGLPVIITGVPAISRTIEAEQAGVIISYEAQSLVSAIHTLLDDAPAYFATRSNAIRLASKLAWDRIFDAAFQELVSRPEGNSSANVHPRTSKAEQESVPFK